MNDRAVKLINGDCFKVFPTIADKSVDVAFTSPPYNRKRNDKYRTTYTKNHITTSVNSDTTTKIHKAVMKQDVADWFIEKFTKGGETVIDPFMGLGTTGVSCKKYGRDFIGIEKNEEYFVLASKRIADQRERSEE